MKKNLKNRIISGIAAFALALSCAFTSGAVFGENDVTEDTSIVQGSETKIGGADSEIADSLDGISVFESTEVDENQASRDSEESKANGEIINADEKTAGDDGNSSTIINNGSNDNTNDDNNKNENNDGSAEVTDLEYQSIELFPDEEDETKTVTLDGFMPKDASAEVLDVTDESENDAVIAAYDITILDGEDEYQPGEEHPISVEIQDPRITEGAHLMLWHVKDDGEREEITDFIMEDGKVSFDAVGFSVYEIVDDAFAGQKTLLALLESKGEEGLTVAFNFGKDSNNNNTTYYFVGDVMEVRKSSTVSQGGRTGLTVSKNKSDGTKVYFEKGSNANTFYMYIKDGENKRYIKHLFTNYYGDGGIKNDNRSALDYADSKDDAAAFTFYVENNRIRVNTNGFYWVADNGDNIKSVVGYKASNDKNLAWMSLPDLGDELAVLNGKTYGLMNYSGGNAGYALMAGDEVHSLVQMVTHKTDGSTGDTLYVDEGSEVTRWTFHTAGADKYTLSGETEQGTKYLSVDGDSLTLTDDPGSAADFKVNSDNKGRIQLVYNNKYVTYQSAGFSMASSAGEGSWLNLLDFSDLTDDDKIAYSADRISVSRAADGQRVIVYTRIWNEAELKYDIYAVDADGSLYPCYASGGKILWLGNGTGSLEWIFTEYYDAVTKEPNYYYELYNPYSEKYLAPQLKGNQVLSDNTIGINMQGRRNGEFYSEITAWDTSRYAYVGLRPNAEKTALEPCAQSVSYPFYFATLEEISQSGGLHEVATVDNKAHGITVKMQDFSSRSVMSDFLGYDVFVPQSATKGLLSTNLGSDGYPTVASGTNIGESLIKLYTDPKEVNHLFIDSIYNSSGYFEFDSCQNFATLCNPDGTPKIPIDGVTDFTVYKELGTTDASNKSTLKHGQFLPYNTIKENRFAVTNGENLYSALANTENPNAGRLEEEYPRKYEKLYLVSDKDNKDNPNYYNGMELETSFVQTVSGLDAWGHDIIFDFTGDDDFWLYVDGELVIDLGGIHSALEGTVNFRTGVVYVNGIETTLYDIFRSNYEKRGLSAEEIAKKLAETFDRNSAGQYIFRDYTTHTMKIFYMERGAGASNLHMRFNIASVTPGNVVVSKKVIGDGADDLNWDFIEYPFQIYYTAEGEDGLPGPEQLLGNDDEHVCITYQNSNKPVTFVKKYRPPGFSEEDAYQNIYFINPTRNAEISFPDNTISYRIVECAVDTTVYGNVLINGEAVPDDHVEKKGNFYSYSSEIGTAEKKPSISFENVINDNVIKDLYITKKLVDEDGHEVTDDPATFSFRLRISSTSVEEEEIPLANMYSYYVLSPDKKLCRYDHETGTFAETAHTYSREVIQQIKKGEITDVLPYDVTFTTSGFGAISGIPSGYTIVVPGLPVGSVFKVTEDIKPGYGLKGYEMVMGEKVNEDETHVPIPSYYQYGSSGKDNVGQVRVEENPQMEVKNEKGYGLMVNKRWNDLNLTTAHQPIYTAVYVDGEFLPDSVRQIKSPDSSVYYFWSSLKPYANGDERIRFDGYTVREVTLGNADPTVDSYGKVTDYGTVTPLEGGDTIRLSAKRTAEATPDGESAEKEYDYVVSYATTTSEDGTVQTDTIKNTRKGGIAVRLFKWNSEDPLQGGTFTLKDSTGKVIGTYTSDSEGVVTMLYSFERNKLYTLTQTTAPKGYVGLQKQLCFMINDDDTVSLFYSDGTTVWGTMDEKDIPWADGKSGSGGITAFVDVYNKPFQFKVIKTDSANPDVMLNFAHFALFKQVKTNISGNVKSEKPMPGFEDMVTENGVVFICGGNSGRMINPGASGSVYYLTEKEAPTGYAELDKDIIFRISALGVPSLISDSYNGQLVEGEDSFTYTLSVPNVRTSSDKLLTIRKNVAGAFGNKTKDFDFTITVIGAGEELTWTKNGKTQTTIPSSRGSFTMRHDDVIVFFIPAGAEVTVTEDNEEYKTTFKLGEADAEELNSKEFTVSEDVTLLVTNTLDGVVPTGVWLSGGSLFGIGIVLLFGIAFLFRMRRKRITEEFLQRMRERRSAGN